MIMKAKMAGINARVPIDSGSEVNHISNGFCARNKIATSSESAKVTMFNGFTENLRATSFA